MAELSRTHISPEAAFGYIPGLDGLRAIAVLIVIIAHSGLTQILPGGFGVTVFFFISGFLITRLLLAEQGKAGAIGLTHFYIRRFLRLIPALLGMIVLSGLILAAAGTVIKIWELIAALTYTMNYHNIVLAFQGLPRSGPWEHLWSLAVEEHFYLLFPLLLIGFRGRLRGAVMACLAVCAAVLIWRAVAINGLGFPSEYTYSASEARLDSIVYGCLLSLMLHQTDWHRFLARLTGWIPVLCALALLLFCFVWRDEAFRQTARYTLQGLALFVLFLNLYFCRRFHFALPVLEIAPMKWIGRVSYGLYLWHIPSMLYADQVLGLAPGSAVFIIVSVGATFLITALSFYYLEQPIISLRRRFGSHAKASAEAGSLAAPLPATKA